MGTYTIDEINAMTPGEFVELFGSVYGSSWWVAEAAAGERPFLDFEHLVSSMADAVDVADDEKRLAAIGRHGDLGQAHDAARGAMRERVASDFEVRLGLPAWVDDEVMDSPEYFDSDEEKMAFVIRLSLRNVMEQTGGPFGAAVFERDSGRLVAPGVNVVVDSRTLLAHAEAMAFMLAQQDVESFDLGASELPSMEIFASSQPCIQCYGMTWWSGVQRLVIGARAADVERITGFAEGPLPEDWVKKLEKREAPLAPIEVRQDLLVKDACEVLEMYRDTGGFVYNAGSD